MTSRNRRTLVGEPFPLEQRARTLETPLFGNLSRCRRCVITWKTWVQILRHRSFRRVHVYSFIHDVDRVHPQRLELDAQRYEPKCLEN